MTHDNRRHYSSGVMASVPVIRGTRVPLWTLIEYLETGRGLGAFLKDHPQVTPAQTSRALVLGLRALAEGREVSHGMGRGTSGRSEMP